MHFEYQIPADVELDKELGGGGYAKVYQGTIKQIIKSEGLIRKIPIAVKRTILKPLHPMQNPELRINKMRKLVMKEISILERAVHPNIVKYYGFHETKNEYIDIYLECCEASLKDKFERDLPLNPKKAMSIFRQIFKAVLFLRDLEIQRDGRNCEQDFHGIYHRDINLKNTLITKNVVKLTDFGLSRSKLVENLNITLRTGTPIYMSPENWRMEQYDLEKNDVWSLGVLLYQLLNGYRAYNVESAKNQTLVYKQDIPKDIQELIKGMLQKQEDRFDFQKISEYLEQKNRLNLDYKIPKLESQISFCEQYLKLMEYTQNFAAKILLPNHKDLYNQIHGYLLTQAFVNFSKKYYFYVDRFVYESQDLLYYCDFLKYQTMNLLQSLLNLPKNQNYELITDFQLRIQLRRLLLIEDIDAINKIISDIDSLKSFKSSSMNFTIAQFSTIPSGNFMCYGGHKRLRQTFVQDQQGSQSQSNPTVILTTSQIIDEKNEDA